MADNLETAGGLAPLIELLDAINSLADPQKSDFESLLRVLPPLVGCDCAVIRWQDTAGAFQVSSHPSLPEPLLNALLAAPIPGQQAISVFDDLASFAASGEMRDSLQAQRIGSLVLCRLAAGGAHLGELVLTSEKPRLAESLSMPLLQMLTTQLSAILAHRQSAARASALENERPLLHLRQEIAARANRAPSFEDALRFAVDRICEFTKWPLGHAFWLEDGQGIELVSSGIWHCSVDGKVIDFQSGTADMRLAAGADDWLGQIVAGAAGGWRALEEDQSNGARLQVARELGLLASYTFPVRAGERVFAILEFFSPVSDPPSPDIVQAMDFVADQLSRVVAREETQRALRRSENLLGEAQRLANLGSWEWDIAADRLTWSDELYRIYGVSQETFQPTYERFLRMVHPDDRGRVAATVQQAFEARQPFAYFHRIIRGDGIVRTLHARGYPVLDHDGQVARMYGSGQDVTDQQQTEEALRKSEKSYRTLARNIPDAVVALYDHDLRLTLVEGMISPFPPGSVPPDTSLRTVLPDADIEGALQPFYDALQGKSQSFERQYDGRTFLLQAVPVRDADGQIFAGIAMAQDVTARKQAEQKLILRAQQLSALHEMGQAVAASLDLDVVFRRVLETLRPLVSAEGVFVLLREDADTLVFAAANEVGVGNLTGQRVPTTRGVAADVVRTGRLQWLQGDETLERVYHELKEVAHYHPRAIIAAPLNLRGKLIGVMEAVHSRPDAFGEDEKAMMETAANWVAIAIGNARQHGLLQHRLQESEAIAKISRALSQTLDLDLILDLIVNSARDLMSRADASIFYFLHTADGGPRLVPVAGAGDALFSQSEHKQSLGAPVSQRFLALALEATLQPRTESSQPLTYQDDAGALIAVPVRGREGSVGLLCVHSTAPEAFAGDDHRLLTMLGRQAAMAVENARLFQEQRRARRAADTLRAANVALSQSLELTTVLRTLLDYAAELIGFDAALVLLAQRNNRLYVEVASNLPQASTQLLSLQNHPRLQQILVERTPHVLQRSSQQDETVLPPDLDLGPGSWLLVPLLSGERQLGVLVLGSRSPQAYGDQQAALAEGLAAQASIAIQNARLFAEVQSSQARLRMLSRQIVNAQEEERQRISRELHDEAGQALTALKISLEMMRAAWAQLPEPVDAQLGEAIEMTDNTMEQIRLLAHDLRPPVLDTFGLSTSIEGLARDFGRRTRLHIGFDSTPLPDLPDAVAVSFYRFVQEALTNVARHAQATEVSIELRHDNDKIMVCVTDDGRGFDVDAVQQAPQQHSGIGLMGMQDRFELLDGWIEIETAPGQGTSVSAYVPYREDE